MTDVAVQRPDPPLSQTAAPFWDATRDRRLVLQHCTSCGHAIWFPRALCPECSGTELEWRDSSGLGAVYAVSVQYRAANAEMSERVPYAVVLVDLDDGVRLMSNVFGCDAEEVIVGMRVEPDWELLPDGRHLLVFQPAAPTT